MFNPLVENLTKLKDEELLDKYKLSIASLNFLTSVMLSLVKSTLGLLYKTLTISFSFNT